MQSKKRGFILTIENVAAIAVLLLVVGIGLWNFLDPIRSSKVNSARGECSSIAAAVSQYHYEIGEYPASLKELTKKKGNFGPWIATIPDDPWGNSYEIVSTDNRFVVYAKGSGTVASAKNASEDTIDSSVAYVIGQ